MYCITIALALYCVLAHTTASALVDEGQTKVIQKSSNEAINSRPEVDDWWNAFCNDPAKDTQEMYLGPPLDAYDTRLINTTGCDSLLVPKYNNRHVFKVLTQQDPETRLAVRSGFGEQAADVIVFLDGIQDYYFTFSNTSNTLEFFNYITWRLWKARFSTPVEGRDHYLPLHLNFTEEGLQWRAGCGAQRVEGLEKLLSSKLVENITLQFQRSYNAKLLYNCPKTVPRKPPKESILLNLYRYIYNNRTLDVSP